MCWRAGEDSLFFGGGVILQCPAKESPLVVYLAVIASQGNFKWPTGIVVADMKRSLGRGRGL